MIDCLLITAAKTLFPRTVTFIGPGGKGGSVSFSKAQLGPPETVGGVSEISPSWSWCRARPPLGRRCLVSRPQRHSSPLLSPSARMWAGFNGARPCQGCRATAGTSAGQDPAQGRPQEAVTRLCGLARPRRNMGRGPKRVASRGGAGAARNRIQHPARSLLLSLGTRMQGRCL